MEALPEKVRAVTYEVPLYYKDKVIGSVTVEIEKTTLRNMQDRYVRAADGEVDLTVKITDASFQHVLSNNLVSGFSLTPEEE